MWLDSVPSVDCASPPISTCTLGHVHAIHEGQVHLEDVEGCAVVGQEHEVQELGELGLGVGDQQARGGPTSRDGTDACVGVRGGG